MLEEQLTKGTMDINCLGSCRQCVTLTDMTFSGNYTLCIVDGDGFGPMGILKF